MDDMVEGYRDGSKQDAVPPGPNRSASYAHGWMNGRDDRLGMPRASAEKLRDAGKAARLVDAGKGLTMSITHEKKLAIYRENLARYEADGDAEKADIERALIERIVRAGKA